MRFQEHHAHGEPHRGVAGVRRRMAQLPSRVPLGLQSGRVGQLPAEPEHGFYRLVRATGAGVQPEDCEREPGGKAVPEDGRRYQRSQTQSSPRRVLGMG